MITTSGQDGFNTVMADTESHPVKNGSSLCELWPSEYPDWVEGATTAKFNGNTTVCGGGTSSSCYILVPDSDSDSLQWQSWTSMGDERKHHSMIVLPDARLWILGGANKYANALDTTEFLSKVSQSNLCFIFILSY